MLDVMEIDIDRPEKVVYVVGLGPGEPFYMTQQAANTLESVDAICGYKVYLDLIRDEFPCEEYYATGMTQELDRCRWALEKARTGKRVALVCSGDAGVYGMASPLLELAPDYPDVAVEVVPGLTAALSGGAVLGAPLAHDFCVISLSDRLTPWEVIEKRLACAAMGDFCVALYNPSSKGRPDYLARAVCILLESGKSADTVCGIVRNIGREGQTARILTLAQLESTTVDMFTTVYIGNAATKQLGSKMVTPRGTADEGSGFQRHYRGAGVLPAAGALGAEVLVSVATPLGAEEQGKADGITVHCGRLTPEEMTALLQGAALCIDATHPYAVTPQKTSGLRVPWPGWSTTGCCGKEAPCLPGAWYLPPPPTRLHFWPGAAAMCCWPQARKNLPPLHRSARSGCSPGCCPRGRALPPARPPVSRTGTSLPCRGLSAMR